MFVHLLFFNFVVKMFYARCRFKDDFFPLICGLIKVTGILVLREYLSTSVFHIFTLYFLLFALLKLFGMCVSWIPSVRHVLFVI